MQQLITDNNQVVLLAGPEKEGVKYPTKEEIAALLKQMKSFDLKPYEDKVSNEPLFSEELKGGKIVSEKAGDIYGTTKLVLSNGVTVYVKPTDFKADQIVMKGVSFGGTSIFPNEEIINIAQLNGVAWWVVSVISARLTWAKLLPVNVQTWLPVSVIQQKRFPVAVHRKILRQ